MREKLKDPLHISEVMNEYLEELEQQATSTGGLFRTQEQRDHSQALISIVHIGQEP